MVHVSHKLNGPSQFPECINYLWNQALRRLPSKKNSSVPDILYYTIIAVIVEA